MIYLEGDFNGIMAELHHKLIEDAPQVNTGHWQSVSDGVHEHTRELSYVSFETLIPGDMGHAQWIIEPNLPWAEDHFQERIGGKPTNPGEQFMNWPWYRGGVEDHKTTGQFSHTYQERVWPRKAGKFLQDAGDYIHEETDISRMGIRYRLGDLNDLVALLIREPTTRQAYLPIWFPEDTGAAHGERVPCSLGYHFMMRDYKLHCNYFMRSVDFVRYLRDDVYMAMRLTQEICDRNPRFFQMDVSPGTLHMHISSLHIFEGDMGKMLRERPERP